MLFSFMSRSSESNSGLRRRFQHTSERAVPRPKMRARVDLMRPLKSCCPTLPPLPLSGRGRSRGREPWLWSSLDKKFKPYPPEFAWCSPHGGGALDATSFFSFWLKRDLKLHLDETYLRGVSKKVACSARSRERGACASCRTF